jgi:hypothetical protein
MAREFNRKYVGSVGSIKTSNEVTSPRSFTEFLYKLVHGTGKVIVQVRKAESNREYRARE